MPDLKFGDSIIIDCQSHHHLTTELCSARSFEVRCEDDGLMRYVTGGFSSSTGPSDLRCSRVSCPVDLIDSGNGQIHNSSGISLSGSIEKTEVARLTCNSGYHISPVDYTGTYPLPSHPQSIDFECGDDCTFSSPPRPTCLPRGCGALLVSSTTWMKTTDGQKTASLLFDGLPATSIPAGMAKEGESLVVRCPDGYFIDDDGSEPANSASTTALSTCTCSDVDGDTIFECAYAPKRCSRRTCPNFMVSVSISLVPEAQKAVYLIFMNTAFSIVCAHALMMCRSLPTAGHVSMKELSSKQGRR